MQKIITLAVALAAMLSGAGCAYFDTELPVPLQEELEEIFDIKNWKEFTFKSIDGKEDLVVTRGETGEVTVEDPAKEGAYKKITRENIETSKYEDKDFVIVAVYDTECRACDQQASYYNGLSQGVSPFPYYNFTFTVVSLDESDEVKGQAWFDQLSDTDVYAGENIQGCRGASCRIFTPGYFRPRPGSVYCVNKHDASRPTEIVSTFLLNAWANSTDQTEINYIYRDMAQNIADCVGTKLISFDATVSDWDEVNTGANTKASVARRIPTIKFEKNK